MKNQEHNNNLDHLFNKAKADKQDLDDFEKEALAGFDMLESEQEAKDLKASLDTRIQKELFTKEEKNNPKVYWLAAAGLALVIGLSTFFIINNNDTISKSGNLAVTTTQENKPELLPESSKELKEQAIPPVESANAAEEKAPSKEIAGKELESKKNELKNLEQKTENTQGKKEPAKGLTSRSVLTPINAGPKDVADSENETSDRKKQSYKLDEVNHTAGENTTDLDDLAKTTGSKGKENDGVYKAPATTVKQDQSVNFAATGSAATSKDITTKEKAKGDDKNAEVDAKINSANQTIVTNSYGYSERREENKAAKKTEKAKKTNDAQKSNSAFATPVKNEEPGSSNSNTKTTSGGLANAPAEDNRYETTLSNCYYLGGETVITKDLKEKLTASNLNQKFDATLFINENKAVTKAEITNAYDLTKNQKDEVIKILKTLCKFNFSVTPKKGEYPYKISYRP